MINNVIQLRKTPGSSQVIPAEAPLALSIPPKLARSIRLSAGMHSKDPTDFLIDWLKSGFPENAA